MAGVSVEQNEGRWSRVYNIESQPYDHYDGPEARTIVKMPVSEADAEAALLRLAEIYSEEQLTHPATRVRLDRVRAKVEAGDEEQLRRLRQELRRI